MSQQGAEISAENAEQYGNKEEDKEGTHTKWGDYTGNRVGVNEQKGGNCSPVRPPIHFPHWLIPNQGSAGLQAVTQGNTRRSITQPTHTLTHIRTLAI